MPSISLCGEDRQRARNQIGGIADGIGLDRQPVMRRPV
jgi:hypothetical protein